MLKRVLPRRVLGFLAAVRAGSQKPPPGLLNWGGLRRIEPISRKWGYDRGTSIYRGYIECFLRLNATDIRGHVLEFGDRRYTTEFGKEQVAKSDVLTSRPGNGLATIIADLAQCDQIPPRSFDCIVCTQVLPYVYDLQGAIQNLYRILKPGGILLATLPGITKISPEDQSAWGEFWRFTGESAKRLFAEQFPESCIQVDVHGNVLVAVAALHGLAWEELTETERNFRDPEFEVLITIRAAKPAR